MASIFDQTRQLLKTLKTGASNFAQYTVPKKLAQVASNPVLNQGIQNVRQSNPREYFLPTSTPFRQVAPQIRQTGTNVLNYAEHLRRVDQNPIKRFVGMQFAMPTQFIGGTIEDIGSVAETISNPQRFTQAPFATKESFFDPSKPSKLSIALATTGLIPDVTDVTKSLRGIKQAPKMNFSLDKNTFDELIDAGEMIKNPNSFIGKINISGIRTKKEALKQIQAMGAEVVERLSAKYLPDKYLTSLKTVEAKIKALVDLNSQNKLANVPNMGFVDDTKSAQGGLSEVKGPMMGFASNTPKPPVNTTDNYLKELVSKQNKAGGSGVAPTLKTKTGNVLADLKAKLVDETAPIQDILTQSEKKGNFSILPKQDVRLQIDRVLRSKNLASQFAEDNGLVNVIKNAPDINALDQYMIAKHAKDIEAGIKQDISLESNSLFPGFKVGEDVIKESRTTGRNLAKDEQLINDLGPQYEKMAQQVNQYSRKLLDYSVKTGLIDKGLADKLVEMYPNYVPLQRVFNELEKATPKGAGKGVASLSKQTVVQNLKGSNREIASPLESLLLKTQDAFSQGERNVAARQLASYKDLPGFEGIIKEVDHGSKAPHTFSYIDNGVKKTFATTPELEAAAKSLNVEQMGLLGKVLSTPTRILQLGATGLNLPFVVTNMLKDELTGFVNSSRAARTSLLNPANYVRSLFSAVKHDDLYKEVVRNAAGGTSFDIAREAPNLAIQKIRNPKFYTVTHPGELLRAIENIVGRGEELGRIKNYQGTKQALLKEGRTAADAALLGAKAARENTANFARRGSWGRVLNWVIPFFNAGIQGSRQLVGSFQSRPAQTATKVAVTMFAPMAAVTAWNLSDPKRKQIYQDIPQYEKENNLIIIPEEPTQDAKGRWNVIKVPLPPGLSNLASLVRRPMEQAEGLDPVRFGEVATNLITAGTSVDLSSSNKIASTFTPQIAKPFVENVTNTNLFTGQKIVPEYLKNRLPEEQIKATTSQGARVAGKALNISPLKIENFMQSQLGGLGSQLLGKESPIENIERRFSKSPSGAIVDKIYTESEKYSALDARIKNLAEAGRKDEARDLINKNRQTLIKGEIANDFKSKLSEYYSDRNKVLNSQTLTPEQKEKILLAIQKKISETSSIYSKVIEKQGL